MDNKVIKKSNGCKYLGLTIDSSLSFMNHVKQTLKKMAQGIKPIDSFGTQLPTSGLEILLHSFVFSHLNYSALIIQHIRKHMMTSLEKQLCWGLKKVFFRSNCKSSRHFRIKKQVSGIEKRIDQLSIFSISENISGEKQIRSIRH